MENDFKNKEKITGPPTANPQLAGAEYTNAAKKVNRTLAVAACSLLLGFIS
jgi:hypothetical protein